MTDEEKKYYKDKLEDFWYKIGPYVVIGGISIIMFCSIFFSLYTEKENQNKAKTQKSQALTCDCQPVDDKTNDSKTYKCICKPKQSDTNIGSELLFHRIINNTTPVSPYR